MTEESKTKQGWQDVASAGLDALAPASRGWILAFVLIFGMSSLSNYLENQDSSEAIIRLIDFLEDSENNRVSQFRRCQQGIRALVDADIRNQDIKNFKMRKSEIVLSDDAETNIIDNKILNEEVTHE